ncbi:hypothetical protein PF006_g12001 [Phytophthora fragariae]|uniref:Uncharacterized protein n=1 Tax=Phytophthora fragariae TaxID=53985 RepID=A0A6A3TWF5_9STRA|nr:hypothetical protein PF011_g10604 [Phytophthora fragariae]KAE9142938.1 hypothetical protein PF006_g12001 [Phytophthora fragariae]
MPAFALPASPSSSPVAASSPPPTQQPAVAPPATSPATASIPPAATPTQPAPTVGSGEDAARPPLAGGLTHRASKRLQKRKADVAARSAERKSKLARSAPPPSGFSLEALLAAPPVLAAAPAVRTKAAGKQKAGSASRAARKPTQPTGPATSDAATGGGSGGAPTLVSGAKAPDRHRRVATASPSPARHTVIYLDSPMPPVSGASGVTLARTAFPPMPNASRDGDTEENFDLASFLESTSAPPPGGATRPSDAGYLHTQPAQTTADEAAARLIAQVGSLSEIVLALRDQLATSTVPTRSSMPASTPHMLAVGAAAAGTSWTLPAAGMHALPPARLRKLRASSFPATGNRSRSDYAPHPTHVLAAHRSIASLYRQDGTFTQPTDTVIGFRSAPDIPFDITIPTASALYCVRLGSQGLSLPHFRPLSDDERLTRSSNNANFSLDFSTALQPPQAPTSCTSNDDILLALSGLSAFANAFWYTHMNRLLDRIRRFVSDNQTADPGNTPMRVKRTLQAYQHHVQNPPPRVTQLRPDQTAA